MNKQTFKCVKKRTFVVLFLVVWTLFGAINIAASTMGYAGEFEYKIDSMRKDTNILAPEIYSATAAGSGDLSGFTGAKTIGFDTLYGATQRDTTYSGEVPWDDGAYSECPHFFSEYIGNQYRQWEGKPEQLLQNIDDDAVKNLQWDPNGTNDLHAYLLVHHANVGALDGLLKGLGGLSFALASILNAPFAFILRLFISFANFDVNALSEVLPLGDLANQISRLFLIDPEKGEISPLLVVALAVFMVGLAGLIAKRIFSGGESGRKILQEIGCLIIAFILMAVSSFSGGYSKLIQSMGTLTTSFAAGIAGSQGGDAALFSYDTGNGNADLNSNMAGLTAKGYIETVIYSQFGYPASELTLWDDSNPEVTVKNWGISTEQMKQLVGRITAKDMANGNQNLFAVSTGGNNNNDSPNIGYWWYAVTSGVDPSDPFHLDDEGKVITNKCDPKQGVLAMDLMAAIHAMKQGDPSSIGYTKTEKIVETFYSHDWKWAEMLFQVIITALLVLAVFFFSIASFVFKIVFNIGFILIPIIPILLLIKKVRDLAHKLLFSWLTSAVIFLLCLICMCSILYISSSLSSTGFAGMMVDVALLIGATFAAPRLVQAIIAMPKQMGLETAGPMNNITDFANKHLGELSRMANKANFAAREKIEQLQQQPLHRNSEDMTGFGYGGNANDYSNEADFALRTQAEEGEEAHRLSKREWEVLQNSTAADFAKIDAMKDSEALRAADASQSLIDAVSRKEQREEALMKRKEEVRQKRIRFYQSLQTNSLLAGHTRIGNHALNIAMQAEEWKSNREARRGYRSVLSVDDWKGTWKEHKEIRKDKKTFKQAVKNGEYRPGVHEQRVQLKNKATQKHLEKGREYARDEEQRRKAIMTDAARKQNIKLKAKDKSSKGDA